MVTVNRIPVTLAALMEVNLDRCYRPVSFSRLLFAVLWIAGICLPSSVFAINFYYNIDRPQPLFECDQKAYAGDVEGARSCYDEILQADDQYSDAERALAAEVLGEFKQANRLFRDAAADDQSAAINTAWGRLYLRTHQVGEASALFREALLIDSTYKPARIGLADALSRQYIGRAGEQLAEILADDPQSIPANLLQARMLLEAQQVDAGRQVLMQVLQYAEQQSLPKLEAYALLASADLLDGVYDSEWTERALSENPSYGGIYDVPAHFYIITYRYREAVALYSKAVAIEPTLAEAQSKLGINLLRINDVNGARHHLVKAYELDPFNTETVNTLRLLDDLDDMRVTYADILPDGAGPGSEPIGRMLLRLDRDEADTLMPYVVELVSDAVRVFTERYDFRLEKPVVVELYHNHDDFGVRTVSTPGVGLLGVTFGYLLAMDSPKARSTEDFHWGSTLWHEMAHVFTLEAANHLLPRWFSEGISVYEEWHTGPLPSRELPVQVLQMFNEGRFLPLADLDSGFVRPTYEGQVNVSYMQAGLVCDYISSRWGHEALVKMLKLFSIGATTNTALKNAIGIETPEFDREFREHIATRYEIILENVRHWGQLGQILDNSLSRLERDAGVLGQTGLDENLQALREIAIQRRDYYPEYIGEGTPYLVLATIDDRLGDAEAALEHRWEWFLRGGAVPDLMEALARDLRLAGRDDDAFRVLESLNWVMPYGSEIHRQLGEYYLARGDAAKAVREFDALLGVRPADASVVLLGKANAFRLQGKLDDARKNVLLALEQAPFYREAQSLLLELNAGE